MMDDGGFAKILSQAIELMIYSNGSFNFADIQEMSADELPFFLHEFKKIYTEKEKNKNEFIKNIIEFAKNYLNNIIKAFSSRG